MSGRRIGRVKGGHGVLGLDWKERGCAGSAGLADWGHESRVGVDGRRGIHPSLGNEGEAKVLCEVLVWKQVVVAGSGSALCHEADDGAASRLSSGLGPAQQDPSSSGGQRQVALRLEGVAVSQIPCSGPLSGPQLGRLVVSADVARVLTGGGERSGGSWGATRVRATVWGWRVRETRADTGACVHITADLRNMALVCLSQPHPWSLLCLRPARAGHLGLDVSGGASRHTAVLHTNWWTALHTLVVVLLGQMGRKQTLHKRLVTSVLLSGECCSNLDCL